MPFDLTSAKPVTTPPSSGAGFDLSSAQPVDRVSAYNAKVAAAPHEYEHPGIWASVGRGMMNVIRGAETIGHGALARGALAAPVALISGLDQEIRSQADREAATNRHEVDLYERGRQGQGFDWGRLAGEAVMSLPLGVLSGGSGVAGAMVSGAAQGGLSGALTAAGEGKDPGTGGLLGAAGGGALGAAGKAVSIGARALWNHIANGFPGSIQDAGVQKVLQRIAADQKAGGPSAQDAVDAVNAARAAGKPMSLADVGGENVKGLAGAVARQPGESRAVATTALEGRDQGAGLRISQDISSGISSGKLPQTLNALMDVRSANAAPLYTQAFQANKNVVSPEVDKILETPAGQKAFSYAVRRMQNLRTYVGIPDKDIAEQMAESGQVAPWKGGVASGLKLQTLDFVKRGLDDQIGAAQRTGEMSEARDLTSLKQQFVNELDKADVTARAGPNSFKPEGGLYKQARAAYSGPSQSIDALEAGQQILRKTPDEIHQEMTVLSPSDREFYRLGAANKLKEIVAKTGANGDEARKIVGNSYVRSQLRPLFDSDDEFNRFVESVAHETTMFRTAQKVLGNSATAARQAEDQSGDLQSLVHTGRGIANLTHGNLIGAAFDAIRLKKELGLRSNPELNTAIARVLFDQGPNAMGGLAPSGAAIAPPAQRALGRLVGGAAPAAGGLSTSIEQDPSQPAGLAP